MGLFTPERDKSQEAKEGRDLTRRRDPMPRILLASLVAATVVLVSYSIRQAGQPIDVTVTASVELGEEGILVSGETNLLDGAILEIWVASREVGVVPERDPDAEAMVDDGSFRAPLSAGQHGAFDSLSRVFIVFEPVRVSGPQNADVLSEYGLFGENLGGRLTVETDRGKRLEQVIDIQ